MGYDRIMVLSRNGSDSAPNGVRLARLTFEAARRAEAMGLVEPGAPRVEAAAIREMAAHIRRAGIAVSAADVLRNVDAPNEDDLRALLEVIVAALEASPVPKYEWRGVGRVFAPEDLADLLGVSVSSLKRYQSGERDTPDDVAARLHFLALVVGDLAGSYNDIGIRRWFQRSRTRLDGRTPASFLKRDWDPDHAGPMRVRALARALVTMSGT
jgi:hypothetical protein